MVNHIFLTRKYRYSTEASHTYSSCRSQILLIVLPWPTGVVLQVLTGMGCSTAYGLRLSGTQVSFAAVRGNGTPRRAVLKAQDSRANGCESDSARPSQPLSAIPNFGSWWILGSFT
eukprot:903262-Amorphochlora_amoeboformis.AAC.1